MRFVEVIGRNGKRRYVDLDDPEIARDGDRARFPQMMMDAHGSGLFIADSMPENQYTISDEQQRNVDEAYFEYCQRLNEQARARALDPTLSARQVAEARRQMEDAAFARDRLSAAVPRLQQRRKELVEAEEDARRWVAYEKTKVERDKLAEELTHVYPPIAEQIAELVARIETNDQQIEHINARALPSGAERLQVVELVRGVPGFSFAPERHVALVGVVSRGVVGRALVALVRGWSHRWGRWWRWWRRWWLVALVA